MLYTNIIYRKYTASVIIRILNSEEKSARAEPRVPIKCFFFSFAFLVVVYKIHELISFLPSVKGMREHHFNRFFPAKLNELGFYTFLSLRYRSCRHHNVWKWRLRGGVLWHPPSNYIHR